MTNAHGKQWSKGDLNLWLCVKAGVLCFKDYSLYTSNLIIVRLKCYKVC